MKLSGGNLCFTIFVAKVARQCSATALSAAPGDLINPAGRDTIDLQR